MKPLKLLLAAMLCMGGVQGALITSGSLSESQTASATSFSSNGTLFLSDGARIDASYAISGGQERSCSDSGSGCNITGFSIAQIGQASGYGTFLSITYSGSFLTVHGVQTQTFQTYFTGTGTASYSATPGPPSDCPFPEVDRFSCSIPVTGSGIATVMVKQYLTNGVPAGFYVSDTTFNFTSTPEPATYLLSLPILGMLLIVRKMKQA